MLAARILCGPVTAALISAVAAGAAEAVPVYDLVDLGSLNDGSFAQARAINDLGMIVGRSRDGNSGSMRATLFDASGGFANVDLGTLGGASSFAYDVNNAGIIVGEAALPNDSTHATRFDSGGGSNVDLGTLGGTDSGARGISETNVIVGQSELAVGSTEIHAARFDFNGNQANNVDLAPVAGQNSVASAVDDSGGIVGEINDGDFRATLFDPSGGGANTLLGDLAFLYGKAHAVNAAGTIVGEGIEVAPFTAATVFDPAGPEINLGTLHGWDISIALGINDAGAIVGSSTDAMTDEQRAALFDPTGGGANLDLNDLIDPLDPLLGVLVLEVAFDINNAGWIVGQGVLDGSTIRHAFLLVPIAPVPEPGTLLLLATGLVLGGALGRCRAVGRGGAPGHRARPRFFIANQRRSG